MRSRKFCWEAQVTSHGGTVVKSAESVLIGSNPKLILIMAVVLHASILPHAVVVEQPLLEHGGTIMEAGLRIRADVQVKLVEVKQ